MLARPLPKGAEAIPVLNLYSAAIDAFLRKSRGELANGKYHLFRGAELLEALYEQAHSLEIPLPETPTELALAVEAIEPSLKAFRSSILEAKKGALRLPPMTGQLKRAKVQLVRFLDDVAVDLTGYLERLALLKARLRQLPQRFGARYPADSAINE